MEGKTGGPKSEDKPVQAERILVTGGCGFIGSNFLHYLLGGELDSPVKVLNVDCMTYAADPRNVKGIDDHPGYSFSKTDICDQAAIEAVMKDFQPEAIVHFAAESHVDRSIEGGDVFVQTNVLGTQILLDAARRQDVPAFLHVSTDEVYGSIREGSFKEGDPYHPASPYAASKAGSDMLALAHHNTYGLPVTITRCTNNYGPRQHPEKLLPKIITKALKDEKLPIYGNGMNVRDWLYVEDHCRAVHHVLGLQRWGEVFNIAAGLEKPNLEVVKQVLGVLGKPESLIEFVPDRLGHDWRYSLDDSKLRSTGWQPTISFEDGLAKTVSWLQQEAVAA